MEYQVAILSTDTIFARMLELEFRMYDLYVLAAKELPRSDHSQVVLLDLDSAIPPAAGSYGQMIGFTKNSALLSVDTHRQCAMILHRPFEVKALRNEVLSCLHYAPFSSPRKAVELGTTEAPKLRYTLDEANLCLRDGSREIALTPIEFRLMQYLLKHRGETVSKESLSQLIGESSANKTEVYICYLRQKTDLPSGAHLIRTVRKQGYRID